MYAMRGCPVIPLVRKSLPAYLDDGRRGEREERERRGRRVERRGRGVERVRE